MFGMFKVSVYGGILGGWCIWRYIRRLEYVKVYQEVSVFGYFGLGQSYNGGQRSNRGLIMENFVGYCKDFVYFEGNVDFENRKWYDLIDILEGLFWLFC